MKTTTLCKYTLLLFCLSQSWGLQAQEVKLTLNITAGSLGYYLGDQKNLVTDLTLTGSIQGFDINVIREMEKLTKLNIAGVNIVPGGFFYLGREIYIIKDQIPRGMFFGLGNLTSVILPNSITAIENQAFQDCSSLTSITIPSGVSVIDTLTFSNCTKLTTFTIPNSVTKIQDYAFWGCTALTSMTIPSTVTTFGNSVFSLCSGLTQINVAATNPILSSVDGVLFNKAQTKLIAYPNSKSSVYTIPSTVTSIDNYAFESCTGLGSVTIGNNVTSLGEGAFYNCTGLTSLSIGTGLTSIGTNAFYNCYSLGTIVIPNNVKFLGLDAFGYCSGLTNLDMGTGITSIDIYAFTYCTSLTSLIIPRSVTSIGGWAFSYCTGLTNIHCKALTPPSITSTTFTSVDKNVCKLYVPIGTSSKYRSATGWSSFSSINEEGTSIQENSIDIKVYASQGVITIENATPEDVIFVYDVMGSLVETVQGTNNIITIYVQRNHIYIVKIAGKTFKVAP